MDREEPSQGKYEGASIHCFYYQLSENDCATPPLVFLDCIIHGPITSQAMLIKGGLISPLSGGRFVIFCSSIGPRSLLHVMEELINLATTR